MAMVALNGQLLPIVLRGKFAVMAAIVVPQALADGAAMEILRANAYLTGKQEKILGPELFAAMADGKHR